MLSNMKFTVRCLCRVPQLSVQSRWTTSTNLNGMIYPLNDIIKAIKVAEVQGTEIKVCFSYIFHVAFMQA